MTLTDLQYVKGLHSLGLALERLPANLGRKVLRGGVAAGARVVKEAAARAAVPPIPPRSTRSERGYVDSGTLARAAIIKFLPDASNDTQIEYIVTFRRGRVFKKSGRDAFYAPWVERGHKIVPRSRRALNLKGVLRNKRTIRARRAAAALSGGRVPAHPFFGSSFAASRQQALNAMIQAITRGLTRELR